MIAANEHVATLLSEREIPTLYRVHERPEPEAVERLVAQLASLGVATPAGARARCRPRRRRTSWPSARVLVDQHVRAHRPRPPRRSPRSSCARSSRPTTRPRTVGHAGLRLAALLPLHLADPALPRPRLPPRAAQRDRRRRGPPRGRTTLEEAGEWTSARERDAMKIERDADAVARCFLLERELYEGRGHERVYDGEVAGVIGAGAFVALRRRPRGPAARPAPARRLVGAQRGGHDPPRRAHRRDAAPRRPGARAGRAASTRRAAGSTSTRPRTSSSASRLRCRDGLHAPGRRRPAPVTIVGAGTLGRLIATVFAAGGSDVRLFDPYPEQLEAGRDHVEQHVAEVQRGARPAPRPDGGVEAVDDLARAVEGAWLVVESVPERVDLKIEVFGELDRIAAADAILATNSSSLPSRLVIDEVQRPERVLNMHFQQPPQLNAVELMSCGETDPAVIDALMDRLPAYGLAPFRVRARATDSSSTGSGRPSSANASWSSRRASRRRRTSTRCGGSSPARASRRSG